MCDPLTIIGLVASAGSAAANMAAQAKVANARKDVMAAERIRQQAYQHEAEAKQVHSESLYQDAGAKQDAAATKLGDMFKGQAEAQDATPAVQTEQSVMPASSSNIVNQEEAKQRAKAQDYTDGQAMALGNLRAFGDFMGQAGRDQARDAGYIGQIGGFMRGSSNVVPLELEQANSAGDGMKMFGDILGLAGKVGIGLGNGGGSLSLPSAGTSNIANSVGAALPTFAKGAFGGMGGNANAFQPIGGVSSLPTFVVGKNPFSLYN